MNYILDIRYSSIIVAAINVVMQALKEITGVWSFFELLYDLLYNCYLKQKYTQLVH